MIGEMKDLVFHNRKQETSCLSVCLPFSGHWDFQVPTRNPTDRKSIESHHSWKMTSMTGKQHASEAEDMPNQTAA